MAEGGDDGNWWGSWLKAAKETSASAFELVKQDLAEFTCTVQHDTTQAVAQTTNIVKEQMQPDKRSETTSYVREGISNFLESISHALTIEPDDSGEEELIVKSGGTFFNRAEAQLNALQLDPSTYVNEPEGNKKEKYDKWLGAFNIEDMKGDISELLVNNVEVRGLYTKLVPASVSHSDFWQRYFFKMLCLKEEEDRRKALKNRAEKTVEHEDISWDDDWDNSPPHSPLKKSSDIAAKQQPQSDGLPACFAEGNTESEAFNHLKKDNNGDTDNIQNIQDMSEVAEKNKFSSEKSEVYEVPVIVKLPSDHCSLIQKKLQSNVELEALKNNSQDTVDICANRADISLGENVLTNDSFTLLAEEESQLNDELLDSINNLSGELEPQDQDHKDDILSTNSGSSTSSDSIKITPEATDVVMEEKELKTHDRGDTVVVGSDRSSPSSTESSKKESISLDDDWEKEFEVTEDDLKAVQETEDLIANKKDNLDDDDDDWENWE